MKPILIVIPLFLLLSCSSLFHYRKVATDTEVTPEKKALIAPWISAHFPNEIVYLQGKETIVIDSTFNQDVIDSLVNAVDSLVAGNPNINIDSLKEAIRKECTPRIVYKTKLRVDTVKVPDKFAVFVLQRDLAVADSVNGDLQKKLNDTQAKLDVKTKKTSGFIIYVLVGLAVIVLQTFMLFKKKPKNK